MIGELVNKILEQSAPPSNIVELTIVEGVKLKFKLLVDMEERMSMEATVMQWAKQMQKSVQAGRMLAEWKEVATENLAILAQCKLLSMLAQDEQFQNELAWLTIAKKAAPVFAGTIAALDQATANSSSDYLTYVEEKKDLSQIQTTQSKIE